MKETVVKELAKKPLPITEVIFRNTPVILTSMGVVGVMSTTLLAIKATPKAMMLLEEEERRKDESLSKTDVIKVVWKSYIPTVIMGGMTIACIVSAHSVNYKRNAAVASAYTITEKALRQYQDQVVQTIGEKKAIQIKDDIVKKKIQESPVETKEVIITGKGDMLCYDVFSDRYFKSDIEKIKQTLNRLSRDLMNEMFITLNDVYVELGLSSAPFGELMGWSIDDGLIEPRFSSHLASDGTPCLALEFDVVPRLNPFD